ncbi:hypothetical protein [Amycolatopsis vancoresmycina]|uniref:Uncharacterized protein n=1 Tax=Amycolatopsis vancoresmycina DSM 44592 TaxID=1292037 RepID=R1HP76_9PSEU|nr:hypothetical protein [Amycolatopsis vancoresmycina]EOD60154.1 hypothetical protein H480_41020 [Amycolatopsis vancoresmycina DSM 44592]
MAEPTTPPRVPEAGGRPPALPASAFGPTGLGTTAARVVPKTGGARPPEAPEPDRRVKP